MLDDPAFADLLRRVRAGDPDAATQLVHAFEPEIRRVIRLQLTDNRLRRTLDSVDICQSVLANFFVRAAAGQFDLDRPEQLIQLLVRMARNRLRDHARRQQADRRDQRRTEAGSPEALEQLAGAEQTPSQIVADRELWGRVQELLTPEEHYLKDQRAQGRTWDELAAEVGENSEVLRKRLSRALDRVARQLGLEEDTHV